MDSPYPIDLFLTRRKADYVITAPLTSNRAREDLRSAATGDLLITGPDYLVQAIINRLFTYKGELSLLGHPDYGSKLNLLIGEINTPRTRHMAEVYIRECLARESRIEEIISISVAAPSPGRKRSELNVTIAVKPVDEQQDIVFSFSLSLEG